MRLRALALLGGLMLLLPPAAALAQSAGDEQYSDPFGDKAPSSGSTPQQSSPTAQAPNSSPTTDSGSQLASDPSSSSSSNAGDSSSSGSLPRTGFRAWLLAAMGGLMLLAGAFLRLVVRPLRVRVGS